MYMKMDKKYNLLVIIQEVLSLYDINCKLHIIKI